MTFTDELKRLTDEAHTRAEQSTFIGSLLSGERSGNEYARLIWQYLPIYGALENATRTLQSERPLSAFYDPRLDREAALRHDLAQLGVDPLEHAPLPTTTVYVERLRSLTEQHNAVRVLAHHYLRYLGDLSGGQIIGRLVQRHYNIPTNALTTWDFTTTGKPKPYKDTYRAKLDTEITPDQQTAFIDECLQGYQLARDLFDDLATAPAH